MRLLPCDIVGFQGAGALKEGGEFFFAGTFTMPVCGALESSMGILRHAWAY